MRRVIAALIVVGLTVAVILLWPSPTAEIPPDTLAGPTTTTTTAESTTTTVPDTTTTTAGEGSHVVETVEEAEEILRELWFGWFEGIYLQDEERIREVVVLEETVETARESFGQMEFSREPTLDLVNLEATEVLRSDAECLALWSVMSVTQFRDGATDSGGVHVVRYTEDGWRLLSVWQHREDLWEEDCDSLLP